MGMKLIQPLSVLAMTIGGLSACGQDTVLYYGELTATALVSAERPAPKAVQPRPRYDLHQKHLVSGARFTFFANFLRKEPGLVLFVHNGTSQECKLIAWRPDSVTVDLPKLGLPGPQWVEIQIVLPDGRIAKTFRMICDPQPDVLVHSDSIPRPMPPVHRGCAVYLK